MPRYANLEKNLPGLRSEGSFFACELANKSVIEFESWGGESGTGVAVFLLSSHLSRAQQLRGVNAARE